jgi:hypothetical protein
MQDDTMRLGLLMEAAHAQQTLAQTCLEALKAHIRDIDALVRDEIRRTLIEELQALGNDSRFAAEALRNLRRAANARAALWTVGMTVFCSAIPLVEAWWFLPSQAQIAALRSRRDELAADISRFERQGARMELRHCGGEQRLCVRVDRKAPVFGDTADYYIVKGY